MAYIGRIYQCPSYPVRSLFALCVIWLYDNRGQVEESGGAIRSALKKR
jgi:hypothetical protein